MVAKIWRKLEHWSNFNGLIITFAELRYFLYRVDESDLLALIKIVDQSWEVQDCFEPLSKTA